MANHVFTAALLAALATPLTVQAENPELANKSNNPLNPAPGLNAQNYYTPSLYGNDRYTNDLLLRGTLPIMPGKLIGVPQILRATVPISTRPTLDDGMKTGLGDINIFDIFLLKKEGIQLGIGPLLSIPTATRDELGTGKWQAGLAAVAIDAKPARLLGALVQYQQSFAGDSDRRDVASATVQPIGIFNLPHGWYVRSSGIWTFDVKRGGYYIPVGLGGGKVFSMGDTIANVFVEPQWTVAHKGEGVPQFSVFAGINFTFK